MTVGSRLWRAALATTAGWLGGMLVTLPLQFAEVARNAGGSLALLGNSLGIAVAVWAVWTLGIALLSFLLAAVPLAVVLPAGWLVRHPRITWITCALAGVVAVGVKFQIWWAFGPDIYDNTRLFFLYGAFTATFGGLSAFVYVRLMSRAEDGERQESGGGS